MLKPFQYQEILGRLIQSTLDSKGTDLKILKASAHNQRVNLQSLELASVTEDTSQEAHDSERGSYSDPDRSFLNEEALRLLKPESPELNGDELFVLKHIRALIDNHAGPYPFKIVDLGGMHGISRIRIAEQLENQIQEKKVEMIVTNLHFNPTETQSNVREDHGETYTRFSEDDWETWQRSKRLVNFINCTTENLPSDLSLIYERGSATFHSYTPGIERLNMLSKLTNGGLLVTADKLHMNPLLSQENVDRGRRVELQNFNLALENSTEYNSHNTITINGQNFPIKEKWRIVTRNRHHLSY